MKKFKNPDFNIPTPIRAAPDPPPFNKRKKLEKFKFYKKNLFWSQYFV